MKAATSNLGWRDRRGAVPALRGGIDMKASFITTSTIVGAIVSALLCAAGASPALAQTSPGRAEAPQFKVADQWKWEQHDRMTGLKDSETTRVVTAITESRIDGTENAGTFRMTPDLTVVDSPTATNDGSAKFVSFPLEVGKRWDYRNQWTNKASGMKGRQQLEVSVVGFEKLAVPAGEFDAFKLEAKGFWNNDTAGTKGRSTLVYWYAPAARNVVRVDFDDGRSRWTRELVELKLQP